MRVRVDLRGVSDTLVSTTLLPSSSSVRESTWVLMLWAGTWISSHFCQCACSGLFSWQPSNFDPSSRRHFSQCDSLSLFFNMLYFNYATYKECKLLHIICLFVLLVLSPWFCPQSVNYPEQGSCLWLFGNKPSTQSLMILGPSSPLPPTSPQMDSITNHNSQPTSLWF